MEISRSVCGPAIPGLNLAVMPSSIRMRLNGSRMSWNGNDDFVRNPAFWHWCSCSDAFVDQIHIMTCNHESLLHMLVLAAFSCTVTHKDVRQLSGVMETVDKGLSSTVPSLM